MKIAIIGAGLSGLTLASRLSLAHEVVVFEKARGPGGRMSTRRAPPYAFDHGAQYFTAESTSFQAFLSDLEDRDLLARWPHDIVLTGGARVSDKPKYVARPGMNAICQALAKNVTLLTQVQVQSLRRARDGWCLMGTDGVQHGSFDWVISSAPADQSAALLPDGFAGQDALLGVEMLGCFALMLGFEAPLNLDWQAWKSGTAPIGWMAVNSAKPERPASFAMLIQSDNAWAQENLERAPDEIKSVLLAAASDLSGIDLRAATHQVLHRWRYASTAKAAGVPFLVDEDQQLAACGDWCQGGKVEAAFLSADALADRILSLSKA